MSDAVSYVLMVTICFIVVPFVLTRGPLSVVGADGVISRFVEWRLEHERPKATEAGVEAADDVWGLFRTDHQRRELRSHLERLRRLVASDQHMSATRQLGNRLAYNRLQLDLRKLPSTDPLWDDAVVYAGPSAASSWSVTRTEIEVLDFRWR